MIRAKTLAAKQKAIHDKEDFEAYFHDFRDAIAEFGVF
jgi:hypothetical protein